MGEPSVNTQIVTPGEGCAAYIRQNKILTIKAVRMVMDSGLKEAKELVDRMCEFPNAAYEIVVKNTHYLPELKKFLPALSLTVEEASVTQYNTTAGIAVKQMVQEALDQDDASMIEALLPAYKLTLGRKV